MKKRMKDYRNPTEALKELANSLDCLTYRPEDNLKYEMVYYGNLWNISPTRNFLRVWYDGKFFYMSEINNKLRSETILCDDKTIAQVRRLFVNDMIKIKTMAVKERLNEMNEDF